MDCACGCGSQLEPLDAKGRPHRFLHGHNARGRGLSESAKDKLRIRMKGWKPTVEMLEAAQQARLVKGVSPETRKKLSEAGRGRNWSPESREKGRQSALARSTPEYRERIRQKLLGHPMSAERLRKMGEGIRRYWADPKAREAQRQRRLRQVLPTKDTIIECLLRAEFKKRRLHFEMHKTMFGHFQPDFVFESARLIVEADGDYWHSLPKTKKRETALAIATSAAGWSVWRFGEREITMHAAACGRAVARFVRDHR